MKRKNYFISILVLILLGLNFLAQTSFAHLESPDQNPLSSIGSTCSQSNSSENAEGCSDPCHVGRCHLGHCSYSTHKNVEVGFPIVKLGHDLNDHSIPNAPFLEGPKRPPRLS